MSTGLLTFTPTTAGEWGDALLLAREYLAAEGLGTHKYVLARMRETMPLRALKLVDLGRLLGAAITSVSIDPRASFFVEAPLGVGGESGSGSIGFAQGVQDTKEGLPDGPKTLPGAVVGAILQSTITHERAEVMRWDREHCWLKGLHPTAHGNSGRERCNLWQTIVRFWRVDEAASAQNQTLKEVKA